MTDSKMPEPVATVTRVTHGSHQRHYQLQWHKDVNLGAELFIRADLAHPENDRMREENRNLRRVLFDDIEGAVSSRLYEVPLKDLHDAANLLRNLLGTIKAAREASK